jgi:hypothetical protein
LAARRRVRPARRRALPGRRLGGRSIAADAGTDDCRAVDRESYPEHIRAVIFVSLISKASREELEVLALHREAALTGVRRRGEEDDVAVGEIAAAGERLDDAALSGKRRVRGRVREGEGDGVADFEGDGSFRARGCDIVDRGSRRLASRGGRRLGHCEAMLKR